MTHRTYRRPATDILSTHVEMEVQIWDDHGTPVLGTVVGREGRAYLVRVPSDRERAIAADDQEVARVGTGPVRMGR